MHVLKRTRLVDCMTGAGAVTAGSAITGMAVLIGLGSVPGLWLTAALLAGLVLAVPGVFARIDRQGDLSSRAALQRLHRTRQHRAEALALPVVRG